MARPTSALGLDRADVRRARTLARQVGMPIVDLAQRHTTVSVERATLRLLCASRGHCRHQGFAQRCGLGRLIFLQRQARDGRIHVRLQAFDQRCDRLRRLFSRADLGSR